MIYRSIEYGEALIRWKNRQPVFAAINFNPAIDAYDPQLGVMELLSPSEFEQFTDALFVEERPA